MTVESYKSIEKIVIGWNLNTLVPKKVAIEKPKPISDKPSSSSTSTAQDHCAPGLNKDERIRRLGAYGTVRQTSSEAYQAGAHSVSYSYSSLISCY